MRERATAHHGSAGYATALKTVQGSVNLLRSQLREHRAALERLRQQPRSRERDRELALLGEECDILIQRAKNLRGVHVGVRQDYERYYGS